MNDAPQRNPAPGFEKHPNHEVAIASRAETFRVTRNGAAILESSAALDVRESGYPPVLYFPIADAALGALTASDHETYCPFKGQASYWSLAGEGGQDAVWGYKAPYDETAELKDHIAFYSDRVEISTTES